MGVQSLLFGVMPTIQVIVTARLIDHALGVLAGRMELTQIYWPLLALLGLVAYQWLFYSLIKFSEIRQNLYRLFSPLNFEGRVFGIQVRRG